VVRGRTIMPKFELRAPVSGLVRLRR